MKSKSGGYRYPEPLPPLSDMKTRYFKITVALFAMLFGFIALRAAWNVYRFARTPTFKSKTFFLSVSLLILFGSLSRALFLSVDPFNTRNILPQNLTYLMFTTLPPSYTCAFCLLFLALYSSFELDAEKRDRLRSSKTLVATVLAFFGLKFGLDALLILCVDLYAASLGSLFLFLAILVAATAMFVYMFPRLHAAATQNRMLVRAVLKAQAQAGSAGGRKGLTMGRALFFTLLIAILNLLLCVNYVVGVLLTYDVLKVNVSPFWTWWGYSVVRCCLEFFACVIMLSVTCPDLIAATRSKKDSTKELDPVKP